MRKRLIVCFDGTWNSADSGGAATNVERIARAIRANSGDDLPQLVLYLRGVGTTGHLVQRMISGATGEGVDDNIRSGYMFLAQNYVPKRKVNGETIEADEIFLFGFSRGAFTARSLAGFIGSAGLLKRQKLGDIDHAWKYYQRTGPRNSKDFCEAYKSDCHHEPEIKFLGVWDTVGALGVPSSVFDVVSAGKFQFHDTEPSKIVRNAFHALAIDEHRDEFVPTLWTGRVPEGCHIEQVWFAGAHSDIGGGYEDRELADIPLAWMAEKAEGCGLQLEWPGLLPDRAALDPLAAQHESRFNLSRKDRLTPTIRRIMEKDFEADFLEWVYVPLDDEGRVARTIDEEIHESARKRFGKEIVTILNDEGVLERRSYQPKNLAAALGA